MILNKKSSLESTQEFMAKNWWILWVVILLVLFYNLFITSAIADKYDKALKKIDEASKGVIMLDYSGRVAYVDKTTIDATNEGFKSAVSNALRFYSIKDWQTLSNNFKNKISSTGELEKNNADIVEFKENYLSSNPEAISDFLAYEKMLVYLITNDNLPERISPNQTTVNRYTVNGEEFQIALTIEVSQSIYYMENDKTTDKTGRIEIQAEGIFNPNKGTPINPLGIKFTSFKPTYLKKR